MSSSCSSNSLVQCIFTSLLSNSSTFRNRLLCKSVGVMQLRQYINLTLKSVLNFIGTSTENRIMFVPFFPSCNLSNIGFCWSNYQRKYFFFRLRYLQFSFSFELQSDDICTWFISLQNSSHTYTTYYLISHVYIIRWSDKMWMCVCCFFKAYKQFHMHLVKRQKTGNLRN